jgi:asparagine synthase (glutamine-hydrolysing)
MCGINGIVYFEKEREQDDFLSRMNTMNDLIAHRGPDQDGVFEGSGFVFGHRRLSILDLSEKGRQPMHSIEGRYTIVFNGEIFNYQDLRSILKQEYQVEFNSETDTEAIIYAYHYYGKSCVEEFNGMFAFVIWDNEKKEVFAARDRFGQKPFFYHLEQNGNFIFSSELKSLKAYLGDARLNKNALNEYLALGYILHPNSIYQEVVKLEPAHAMLISENGSKIQKNQYWDYASYFRKPKLLGSEEEIKEGLKDKLSAAVKRRMAADVPLGAFLSGGLDSSAIVALMTQNAVDGQVNTFSIGFNVASYDESEDAQLVADHLKTKHVMRKADLSQNEEELKQKVDVFDEPFSDNSFLPMLDLSQLTREHVIVALSGDGADEFLAGYLTYKADMLFNKFKWTPNFLLYIVLFLVNFIPDTKQKINTKYKAKQFLKGLITKDHKKAHYSWRLIFDENFRKAILSKHGFNTTEDPFDSFKKFYDKVSDLPIMEQHLYVDAMTWLSDDILVKVDRTSMKHSIEVRCPFLDHELVEYMARIPFHYKIKDGVTKYLLREIIKEWLPKHVLQKKKSGFNAPIGEWIKGYGDNEFQVFNKFVFDQKVNVR